MMHIFSPRSDSLPGLLEPPLGSQYQSPDDHRIDQAHQHGRAADILGAFGEVVMLQGDAINRGFDGRVKQLYDDDQQHAAYHQGLADMSGWQPQRQRDQHGGKMYFLTESIFVFISGAKSRQRIAECIPQAC